ncbi:MAG: hybrid sensor histidine kinase/response regulator [Betaproteobacteria bacterium]|nr:hybrid sensor histidine kinase/response regulator [Betaproteobacteria bacterium]
MKSDSVLAKTAKGLAAAHGAVGLSLRAAPLLSAIDGRRDMNRLRHECGGLTARDVDDAVEELLRGGYVQVLGAPALLDEEPQATENPELLLSLDFSALRTQRLRMAAEVAVANEAEHAEEERRAIESETSGTASDATRGAQAQLEAEMRGALVKTLRPRVEEALRVKLAATLRPKIVDELRRTLGAALRPRLEAAVRAQLEVELKPRIELELRARFARQIADMRAQLRDRGQETALEPVVPSEARTANEQGAARVFACLSEAVFATDALGVLTSVNAAWAQLSAHGEGEIVGKALSALFADGDRRGVEAFLLRVAQGTAIHFAHEAQLQRGDGTTVWVELRAAPLALASGEPAGVCGVLRETAEARRAAAESEDASLQLLLLVDESDAGILIEDAEGTIRQVNPAFCALFGVQAAPFSFEGSAAAELMQEIGSAFADVDELLTHMARIRAAAADVDGCDIALSRGCLARLSYRAVAEDGAPRGHLWIFRLAPVSGTVEFPP